MTFNRMTPYPAPLSFLRRNAGKPNTAAVRFGRDAIFERNNALQDRLERNPHLSARENIKDVFTATHGRVCRRSELPQVLEQARAHYEALKDNPNANAVEKGLAGIKLANAQLAADDNNEAAFVLLTQSIDSLDQAGYLPLSWLAPPDYIHGLYNRGCYAFNNVLHQYNMATYGAIEMASSTRNFEGLTVAAPINQEEEEALIDQILEGIPFLEKAIMLSEGMPDQKLANVEYQSAKGEVMHALSHLVESTYDIFDRQALSSFADAWKDLRTITPDDYTPQHIELEDKLSKVKIPHLCSDNHITEDAGPLCQMFEQRNRRGGSSSAAAMPQHGNAFTRSKIT